MMKTPKENQGVCVEVRDLQKSYRGQQVLRGLNFEVRPGEIFVIMGPSGSGKSVLLRHIIGLEPPDVGDILIQGESIRSEEIKGKYRLAMVFQSGALLNSLTVGENVALYLSEHRLKAPEEIAQIVSKKLEVVGLEGTEDKMPAELSGGMKKRVALARALIMEPQLILYDEPTSELDPLSGVAIAREIVALNSRIGVTTMVVTHERQLAFGIAHRIAVMTAGEIIAMGSPQEVRESKIPEVVRLLEANLNVSAYMECV